MNPSTRKPDSPLVERARSGPRVRWAAQVVAVAAAVVELAVPVVIAQAVTQMLGGDPITPAVWLPMLAVILGSGVLAAGLVMVLTRIAAAEVRMLRLAVATRLITLMPRTVERLGVGEATALYSHHANELEPLLTADIIRRRTAIITTAGCFVLMIWFEWRLTLALLVALVLAALVVSVVLKPVKDRAVRGLNALGETAADIGEYLGSIRSATVYGLGSGYERQLGAKLDEVALMERRVGHAQALVDLIVKTTSMLLLIALGGLGMFLVSSNVISLAELAGFLGALAILLAPAARYAELIQQVRTARAAESRIEELPPEPTSTPRFSTTPARVADVAPVDVVDATVAPAEGIAVGPVSFSAHVGQLVCLVGPSGSGKTSILSAIAGFAPVAGGHVRVGGCDVEDWSASRLWGAIGYVEQSTPTLGGTVRSFLTPDELVTPDEETLRALLTAFGLDGRFGGDGIDAPLERAGTSLSGGERQRLSIVRALASGRPLLLFDEPTAHLDAKAETAVLDAIDDHRRERLLLVATHSERVIERADHVVDLSPAAASRDRRAVPLVPTV